jgi:hypothetical protein
MLEKDNGRIEMIKETTKPGVGEKPRSAQINLKEVIANLGLSIAAVVLAAGIVVALDYIYRPVVDGNGNAVSLRGSVQ